MKKSYVVTLTDEERGSLRRLVSSGKGAARKLTHARILLKADASPGGPNWTDAAISEGVDVGTATVERVRQRFVEEGLDAALVPRKPDRIYERKLDGDGEAHLIALACSESPEGRSRWTLELLADRMVALGHVGSLSYQTVRRVLKKTRSSLG
jgi:transposase